MLRGCVSVCDFCGLRPPSHSLSHFIHSSQKTLFVSISWENIRFVVVVFPPTFICHHFKMMSFSTTFLSTIVSLYLPFIFPHVIHRIPFTLCVRLWKCVCFVFPGLSASVSQCTEVVARARLLTEDLAATVAAHLSVTSPVTVPTVRTRDQPCQEAFGPTGQALPAPHPRIAIGPAGADAIAPCCADGRLHQLSGAVFQGG